MVVVIDHAHEHFQGIAARNGRIDPVLDDLLDVEEGGIGPPNRQVNLVLCVKLSVPDDGPAAGGC